MNINVEVNNCSECPYIHLPTRKTEQMITINKPEGGWGYEVIDNECPLKT